MKASYYRYDIGVKGQGHTYLKYVYESKRDNLYYAQ